ncbi:MAG: polyisoprenoid-binding protein [Anaerolineae bacterium]|nr:polyisoprenoid-binding protein [Anaerolineae bacterium]
MARWKIDVPHTLVEFSVRHMMVTTVRGSFERFDGFMDFDAENPANSYVEVQIETASINTRTADRDAHLRSGDFFEAEKHPHMIFKSNKIEITGENSGKIYGDLTIRDVTRPVVLEVEHFGQGTNPYGMQVAGFGATTSINREDFGLTWNQALEAGGVLVSKDVRMELNVQAVLQTETAPAS